MSEEIIIIKLGWSPYYNGSKGGVRKYHYFANGLGLSVCGHVTLTESKRKSKFIDIKRNCNQNKFCYHCKKLGFPTQ